MNERELTLGGTCAGTGNEVFGIDLGTTYSAIAWLDQNGKPEAIPNVEGSRTTASVVYFENEKNVSVGDVAKEMIAQEPDRVVSFIKREMKNSLYSFTTPDGKSYNPIEVSGFILKKLVNDAEIKIGSPVKKVVITCPAYFGTVEHQATKEAGKHIGLEVLKVLNEPTAAAYAYGIKEDEPQTIMVYDLGGGTFDVTIIKVDPTKEEPIEVIVTGGDSTLGGKNWDAALVELFARKWKKETGEDIDILSDENFKATLMVIAEKNKKFLSTKDRVRIRVAPPDLKAVNIEITREEFEEETSGLLETTISATNETLKEAALKEGVENFEFDTLLCVGGSSLMPQVAARLEREYGKTPKISDPHECVAKGAAIYAGLYLGPKPEEDPPCGDVLSKSYGIIAYRKNAEGNSECVIYNLLLKNQSVNTANHKHIFKTQVGKQKTIKLRVVESEIGCWENSKAENLELGIEDSQNRIDIYDDEMTDIILNGEMVLPPDLDPGSEVEVTFFVDSDMVLNVHAVLLKTGEKVELRCDSIGIEIPEPLEDGITVE